jgi:hypothetical protein
MAATSIDVERVCSIRSPTKKLDGEIFGAIQAVPVSEREYGSLLMEDEPPLINIDPGEDVTIREFAEPHAGCSDLAADSLSTRPGPAARPENSWT